MPALAASKSKTKPSLLESWEASPEDRATIRDLVLDDYFALADGRNICTRIRGTKRDVVIRDFLDALGVDGMREVMSPEFRKGLRAELPGPNAWLVEKDAGTIARKIVEVVGRPKADAIRTSLSPTFKKLSLEKTVGPDGKPIHALPRGNRQRFTEARPGQKTAGAATPTAKPRP